MRKFMPYADERECRVTNGDEYITFSPAEASVAAKLVGDALRMRSMKVLPTHISGSPFVIRFLEDDTLRLERKREKGSLPFGWNDGDDVILAVQDAEKMAINERIVIRRPRGVGFSPVNESLGNNGELY